jgi:VanZ family protein
MSIKALTKVCSVAALLLLVLAALGPGKWVPRSGLGWQIDHFVGYFALTLMVCFAWPRPVVVGATLMGAAVLLEGLQAFTPDRFADLHAAMYSAGGALAAVLPADLFIRARLNWRTLWIRAGLLTFSRRGRVPASGVTRGVGSPIAGIGRPLAVRLTPPRRIRETL